MHFGDNIDDTIMGANSTYQEKKKGANSKLEVWKDTLEFNSFRLSRTKIKYMQCKFSVTQVI
jgi:hypothetical protein